MKQKVGTRNALKTNRPYSQAVHADNLIFTSGQIAVLQDGSIVNPMIEDQTHQVMKNLKTVLESEGISFAHVVKTTIYLTEMSDYKIVNEIYGSYMSNPYPTRETVGVRELPLGVLIEISMIAVKKLKQ